MEVLQILEQVVQWSQVLTSVTLTRSLSPLTSASNNLDRFTEVKPRWVMEMDLAWIWNTNNSGKANTPRITSNNYFMRNNNKPWYFNSSRPSSRRKLIHQISKSNRLTLLNHSKAPTCSSLPSQNVQLQNHEKSRHNHDIWISRNSSPEKDRMYSSIIISKTSTSTTQPHTSISSKSSWPSRCMAAWAGSPSRVKAIAGANQGVPVKFQLEAPFST